jgi:dTDP-4-dehydrorhamnose reductase
MKPLIIGASGQLGRVLSPYFPEAETPSHKEMDILWLEAMQAHLAFSHYDTVIVLAGLKNQDKIELSGHDALQTNIIALANIAQVLSKTKYSSRKKLVYVSTEYVYPGTDGNYCEADPILPQNRYIWSKIGAEACIHMLDEQDYLIIRCAFSTKPWHRKDAYVDQWTSREEVSDIAAKIAKLIIAGACGTFNVGCKRRRLWDYANSIKSDNESEVIERSYLVDRKVPRDTSMNTTKYENFIKEHNL